MAEVFAVDFDGIICDTARLKKEYIMENYGIDIPGWQANRSTITRSLKIMSNPEYDKMVEEVLSLEMTMKAAPVDDRREPWIDFDIDAAAIHPGRLERAPDDVADVVLADGQLDAARVVVCEEEEILDDAGEIGRLLGHDVDHLAPLLRRQLLFFLEHGEEAHHGGERGSELM